MKPTIGRIVHYTSRRTSTSGPAVDGVIEVFPAIIVRVHAPPAGSGDVNEPGRYTVALRIFRADIEPPAYEPEVYYSEQAGTEAAVGRWSWPPR